MLAGNSIFVRRLPVENSVHFPCNFLYNIIKLHNSGNVLDIVGKVVELFYDYVVF